LAEAIELVVDGVKNEESSASVAAWTGTRDFDY
jgi:hypothetical protein